LFFLLQICIIKNEILVDFYQLSLILLPDYFVNTSETMCDFPDNKFFVCNHNYMNYKLHIKTLRHYHNRINYDNSKKKEEKMNKMEIEK
jgi:hypothetical protein